jgi:ADP-ribosylglycohydrolase
VTPTDVATGCLLGGAVGDALGAGIEFDSWSKIRGDHGPTGVDGYVRAYGRRGAITDDTQMTMFTAEGLIRASVRQREKGISHPPSIVRHAYLRWLWTQGDGEPLRREFAEPEPDGWLCTLAELRARRAPGNTCLSALERGGDGSTTTAINGSKGCGGVMRAAPVGFVPTSPEERFELGCDVAALTHGEPSAYLPAGYLAAAVGAIVDGQDLHHALDAADDLLRAWDGHAETAEVVDAARRLGHDHLPEPQELESLGGGWTGHEALAIALACVESTPSFEAGVLAAVNHSGDSDSTGSIAGNLLGALDGVVAIPIRWLDELELREEIEQLAGDLVFELHERTGAVTEEWWSRYPGW